MLRHLFDFVMMFVGTIAVTKQPKIESKEILLPPPKPQQQNNNPGDYFLHTLLQAREKLKRGWCQKTYVSWNGYQHSYCLLGSLGYQDEANRDPGTTVMSVTNYLQMLLYRKTGTSDLATWNDDMRRTHREVLDFMDEAIVEYKKRDVIEH